MKKLILLLSLLLTLASCSTTSLVGNMDSVGSTINEGNNTAGRTVTRYGSGRYDEIYYIPLYRHNW